MIDIEKYMEKLVYMLYSQYGTRLLYVGLQGSYLRGEANDSSDIDVMTVIDGLSVQDLDSYRAIIQSMEKSELCCGFICSKADLAHWNPLEICGVLHGTKDYYKSLAPLVPEYTDSDIRNFIKVSLNNLYHAICHRYIYSGREKSEKNLPGEYKNVFFILQNLYYLQSGRFIPTKAQLIPLLSGKNKLVMERALSINRGGDYSFEESFSLLFTWCQETLASL